MSKREDEPRRSLGMPNIKGECAPMHPDDIVGDISDEIYAIQLKLYNDYYYFKRENGENDGQDPET